MNFYLLFCIFFRYRPELEIENQISSASIKDDSATNHSNKNLKKKLPSNTTSKRVNICCCIISKLLVVFSINP